MVQTPLHSEEYHLFRQCWVLGASNPYAAWCGYSSPLFGCRFELEKFGFQRVEILVPKHSLAGRRAAEKAGAKFERILRNRVVLVGKLYDVYLYILVRGDIPLSCNMP
jgi:hypothetical protein